MHTLTCTRQIASAGRKTTAHPHSCTSDLRHGKSFSHSKEIFSLFFFTFLCTGLFSLSTRRWARAGHAAGSRIFCLCIPVNQGTNAGSCSGEGRALGHPALSPQHVAQGQGGLKALKFLFFLPKVGRRGGQLQEQRCNLLCQGELSGLRTSAVTPQWGLVPVQGGG